MHLCSDYASSLHKRCMNKRERQQKILGLIQATPIGTQEDLRALLERSGVPATQSSVSRDLEELGVVKHHGHYTLPRTNGAATRGLLSLDQAGDTLIIARTVPGLASAVAVEIHCRASFDFFGTISGEVPIFSAVRDAKSQRAATKEIWDLFRKQES